MGTTDVSGNYEINGINYGSGTTFTATPSKVTPINSYSLDFDPADNGYVNVDYDARLNPSSFTLELWAKVEGGAGTWRSAIMSRDDNAISGYNIYAGNDNKWQFWTGAGSWQKLFGPDIELDTWTHLAAVYNASTNMKIFYVDGVLADSSSTQGYVPADSSLFTFGAANTGNNLFFDGHAEWLSKEDNTSLYWCGQRDR